MLPGTSGVDVIGSNRKHTQHTMTTVADDNIVGYLVHLTTCHNIIIIIIIIIFYL